MEYLPLSVGIGLAVSLLFTEMFGIAAGGLIVPGYVALNLTKPVDVALTIGAGFATWAIVHTLSSFTIIYGRRRTVLMILIGYLVGMLLRWSTGVYAHNSVDMTVIGFIIPGLIALWLDRQGVIETVAALITASVVVRLILVLAVGAELRG
ncbi:MAG: poly-gamma-glutamate biosynthesis protein PgsC [Polyangiaceae bacterium]|nr:poly-gamma-glutamate biosynthesis protein PgsC [Polyangiaceae bacterium]MBK8995174.1 poly-gamma-glutamate biosynthesis protein PgsC [Myxococcales bacterium]MCE7890898.1 poly-gamma-glutamate biosynthesis protein PgsC [Sorangiineae bacterium PRO1]MCL4750578.1 poly-gamma-glutamate biosynthesis protein PgsC [Myxococcales bacterium]